MADDRTSVVIATHNRCDSLAHTLSRLTALPEQPPVIVVDNASTDGTAEAVRQNWPAVCLIELPENRGIGARNVGVQRTKTPYVAFSDDDSWWERGSLRQAADLFDAHPRLAVIAARIFVGPEQRLDPVCRLMAASPLPPAPDPLPGPRLLGFVACGAVVRRSAYLAVGGFEERFVVTGEEQLLALDLVEAGWELAYVDGITAYHHPGQRADRAGRTSLQRRNDLWVSWLRRPMIGALADTAHLLIDATTSQTARRALTGAVRGLPWVLRERAPISPRVARLARLLREPV